MSGVIEAAGLTRREALAYVGLFDVVGPSVGMGGITPAEHKLVRALRAELNALPLEPGDVVRIPFAPTDTFEVRCVEDDEAWVLDVKSGGRLTVKLDCIERVQP